MPYFKTKKRYIKAIQWFKRGDYFQDISQLEFEKELKRRRIKKGRYCTCCPYKMSEHNIFRSSGNSYLLCPGDWIIEIAPESTGWIEFYAMSKRQFELNYKEVHISEIPNSSLSLLRSNLWETK